jgi:hypothetical protein
VSHGPSSHVDRRLTDQVPPNGAAGGARRSSPVPLEQAKELAVCVFDAPVFDRFERSGSAREGGEQARSDAPLAVPAGKDAGSWPERLRARRRDINGMNPEVAADRTHPRERSALPRADPEGF